MKQIYTVSQVNSYIRKIFDSDYALRRIDIRGEISNLKYHSSGHIYFTLKDNRSALRCVMFSGDRNKGLKFRMQNGQEVTVSGNITVFERDGTYQLYAREITREGSGELYILYEKLKKELYSAGYFDADRKKQLPPYPEKIGIVTAATGAAIQDIRTIAKRRNPYVQLYLYPAKVQGEGAAHTIVQGIQYFDNHNVDIIIIGRGGGSIEDLWAFNEREVADAIYNAKTPIISGTGHETDTTIADYCADVRAATPSAAIEQAIPDIRTIIYQIDQYQTTLDHIMERKIAQLRQRQDQAGKLLAARHPGTRLLQQRMEYTEKRNTLQIYINQRVTRYRHRLELLTEKLTAASPSARLRGGYVYAHDKAGHPIASVTQLHEGQPFGLIFADGEATVVPVETAETPGPAR